MISMQTTVQSTMHATIVYDIWLTSLNPPQPSTVSHSDGKDIDNNLCSRGVTRDLPSAATLLTVGGVNIGITETVVVHVVQCYTHVLTNQELQTTVQSTMHETYVCAAHNLMIDWHSYIIMKHQFLMIWGCTVSTDPVSLYLSLCFVHVITQQRHRCDICNSTLL